MTAPHLITSLLLGSDLEALTLKVGIGLEPPVAPQASRVCRQRAGSCGHPGEEQPHSLLEGLLSPPPWG